MKIKWNGGEILEKSIFYKKIWKSFRKIENFLEILEDIEKIEEVFGMFRNNFIQIISKKWKL